MKYIKILALSLLPLSFSACSEDEVVLNSGDATVEFENASVTIKESVTSVNLPIIVKGEHNGKIVVNATMTEKSDGIEIDKNVIITTETLNLLEGTESVNLEVVLSGVSNDEVVDGRSITFEIKEVSGAKIGTNNKCVINLTENNPMEGNYLIGGYDYFGAGALSCNLVMEEGRDDIAYLDFGAGSLLPITLTNIEEPYKKCRFTIANQSSIGSGLSIVQVKLTDKLYLVNGDFKGKFENNTFTFDIQENYGLAIVDADYNVYYMYLATSDTPLTIYKK